MNLIFVIGKIVTEIDFQFIINSENQAVSIFKIELKNKTIITVKAYNKLADFCYKNLKSNKDVFVNGYLNTQMEIVANQIEFSF